MLPLLRNMRGDEARKHCAELQLIQVPTSHGKADLTIYRNSGSKVHLPSLSTLHMIFNFCNASFRDLARSLHRYWFRLKGCFPFTCTSKIPKSSASRKLGLSLEQDCFLA